MLISAGRFEAEILEYGASLADLRIPLGRENRSIVLGPQNVSDYPIHNAYMGAIAGRCANRIAAGQFVLDGKFYYLSRNERGRTHLHGGFRGFSNQDWQVISRGNDYLTLSLISPDGDEGYPGEVRATCQYQISMDGVLSITLSAVTTAPTLVNLAAHSYFNLANTETILDHVLSIPADYYTPIDVDLIPIGEIAPVEEMGFDFRTAVSIVSQRTKTESGYDHNFVLNDKAFDTPHLAAKLESPARDLCLEIWSTEPGLQFYDGQYLPTAIPLRGGAGQKFGGCCLEPQRFPDGINHSNFSQSILRPGETYRQATQYRIMR